MTEIAPSDTVPARRDLVDQVYERVKALLAERIWVGSENLSDASLAQSLGVSRTPVRMALSRLQSEGLVQRAPGRGWSVSSLTAKDIEEIFDIKESLEAFAVDRAAAQISPGDAEGLQEILTQMRQAMHAGDLSAWCCADDRFHALIFRVADNPRLTDTIRRLDSQWLRYRLGYVAQEEHLAVIYEQHRRMAEAVCARDGAQAAALTLEHLRHVRTSILKIRRDVLSPFMGIKK
jgi:DNA-binding GntR family transcriptional regulator